jgi:hypothetical protein
MGWDGGGGHTTTVVAVNPKANADGSRNLEVYDNATTYETIQLHWDTGDGKNTLNESWTYDTKGTGTDPTTITIYRLSPDHLFLIHGSDTGSWLAGNGMNDKIVGGAGDDFLVGGAGNNVLDGGGGTNTAVFFGPRSEYDITSYTAPGGLVHTIVTDTGSAGDGTDDLVRIQHLQFSDWTYALNGSQLTPLWQTLNDADVAPPQLANQVLPPNLGSISPAAMSVVPQINPLPHVAMGGGGAAGSFSDGATRGSEAFIDADGPLSQFHGNSSWLQLTQAMSSFDADRGTSHAKFDWDAAETGARSFVAAGSPFHH